MIRVIIGGIIRDIVGDIVGVLPVMLSGEPLRAIGGFVFHGHDGVVGGVIIGAASGAVNRGCCE